ncbi:MAG: acylphosphatase [Minisyncoccia bacterium]
MKKHLHIFVSGKVQGVFFRSETKRKAAGLGLFGFAKNLDNGSVEIIAEGEEEGLKELAKWCYNGPKGAAVDQVDFEWTAKGGKFDKFEIL